MNFLKKILRFFITGSFTFVIAACYGAPVSYSGTQTKLRVVNKENQPVKGLMVDISSDYYSEYYYTDENGESVFYPMIDEFGNSYNPVVKDIDGDENLGCFSKTEVVLNDQTEIEVVINENENSYFETPKTCRFITESGDPIPGLKISLGESGCCLDEFITDQNGEIVFNPIINKDGGMENIFVTDEDWTGELGYFGEKEVELTDEDEMEITMEMITPPEETVPAENSEETNSQEI
jgi:hypothetical protein